MNRRFIISLVSALVTFGCGGIENSYETTETTSVELRAGGATDSRGSVLRVDVEETAESPAPIFDRVQARSPREGTAEVNVFASYANGEEVEYTIDWGDGNISRGRKLEYRHSYPRSKFQTYTITISASNHCRTATRRVPVNLPVWDW